MLNKSTYISRLKRKLKTKSCVTSDSSRSTVPYINPWILAKMFQNL